jgi:hypothetical protein
VVDGLVHRPYYMRSSTTARPVCAGQPTVTQSANKQREPAPLPRRRPDTGEIILDRVPSQGPRSGRRSRRAKPVLDAAHDRETLKARVGGEPQNESTVAKRGFPRKRTVLVSTRLRLAAPAARPAGEQGGWTGEARRLDQRSRAVPPVRPSKHLGARFNYV